MKELSERALQYLDGCTDETFELLETLCKIPAPSHHEEKRAEFCLEWFKNHGAEGAYIDEALNVVFPMNCEGRDDIIVFMAHTDTVFPDMEPLPYTKDDEYIYCPGVCDDTVCLVQMMMAVQYILQNNLKPNCGMLFVANACEEGLGNLKGVRQIMKDYAGRVAALYTIDGDYRHIVNRCVGSHRYRVTLETEGGHSYGAFGNKNAIHYMSDLVCRLYEQEVPQKEGTKTTYNVGIIEGGTSVNTIAQKVSAMYEYRSDDEESLATMQASFEAEIEKTKAKGVAVTVELLGERPCSGKVDEAVLARLSEECMAIQSKHSGVSCVAGSGSTDCNIPMSLGVPAVCAGSYVGAGVHTREEKLQISSVPIGTKIVTEMILNYFED